MKHYPRRPFKARLPKTQKDTLPSPARQALRHLQLSREAQREWIAHLQAQGRDTSSYPSADLFLPELGITHHQVFFPDALKAEFHQWFQQEFLPRHQQH